MWVPTSHLKGKSNSRLDQPLHLTQAPNQSTYYWFLLNSVGWQVGTSVKKYANSIMNKLLKKRGKTKGVSISREKNTKQLLGSGTQKKGKINPGHYSTFLGSVATTDLVEIGI